MSDLKLIQMQERSYIICSRRQDKLDWPNIVDPYCNNEIFIDEDFNEACDNIICENCNRDILPNIALFTIVQTDHNTLLAYI